MAEFTPTKFQPIKGLHKIEKVDYRQWTIDKKLDVLVKGRFKLEELVASLKDYRQGWDDKRRQTMSYPLKMDKHINVYLLSNGVDSFVLLVNDMQKNAWDQNEFERTGEQEVTIFIVKGAGDE